MTARHTIQLAIHAVYVITIQAVNATVHQMSASVTANTTWSAKPRRVTTAVQPVASTSMPIHIRTIIPTTVMLAMITPITIPTRLKSRFYSRLF